jgi:hypothetical protein
MSAERSSIWRSIGSLALPVCLSVGWLGFAGVYFARQTESVWALKPNDFGDFFAGVFAPLAFIWFGYAVFLQSRELRLQRIELALTRAELSQTRLTHEHSVEEQKRMVEEQAQQTRIMNDQFRRAEEYHAATRQKTEYDYILSKFSFSLNKIGNRRFSFRSDNGAETRSMIDLTNKIAEKISSENYFQGYIETENMLQMIDSNFRISDFIYENSRKTVDSILESIEFLASKLSEFEREYTLDPSSATRMRFAEVRELANGILDRGSVLTFG